MERMINLDRKLLYSSNVMLWFVWCRSSWVQIHCTSEWISIKMYLVNFVLHKICSLDFPVNNEVCKGPADFNELNLFHTVRVVGGWVVLHFLFLIINVESKLNPEQSQLCNQQLMCVTVPPSSVSAASWFFLDFRQILSVLQLERFFYCCFFMHLCSFSEPP